MTTGTVARSTRILTPADDVDWELLVLLAKTDAALNRRNPPSLSLPDGLDLSHPGDYDWVGRVADSSAAT